MAKIFSTFEGQSKYCSKWWINFYDEKGNYGTKSFSTKKERNTYISTLEKNGYKKVEKIIPNN